MKEDKIVEEKKEKEDKEEKEVNTDNDDERLVVTMRCIDMSSPTYGSVNVPCSECGEMSWLSASSRYIKFDKIICETCFFKNEKYKDEDYHACVTEECINDALLSLERHGIRTTKEEMIQTMEEKIGKKIKVVKNDTYEKVSRYRCYNC